MAVAISNVRPLGNKLLRAFFSIELESGTIIHCCILKYVAERRVFTVIPPGIPVTDPDTGAIARDAQGQIKFDAAISFRKATTRRHFEETCLRAMRAAHPNLFVA